MQIQRYDDVPGALETVCYVATLPMRTESSLEDIPEPLCGALTRRGFTTLTPIQQAVLEPDTVGRDLRLCSQTGSGKTVAIGLVIARDLLDPTLAHDEQVDCDLPRKGAHPDALVVAPTRELAAQLSRELTWLLRGSGRSCCTITGGASYPMQMKALRDQPSVVIGTPGRLRDHVERGFIDLSTVRSVVLDEADQMLDMGFREDLEAIVDRAAPGRRMHMASATFPPEAQALAARYQTDPRPVFGTKPGEINADITHQAHLVRPEDRLAALINVLLLAPEERTLVFVRTRADASNLAQTLGEAGFSARPISGDLEQAERTRTLGAFRSGVIKVLVATDVAARGLDIPDVGRVVHADPPGDSEVLTHRSGRTGRAGKKGLSILIVTPPARDVVARMISRAKIPVTWCPSPTPDDVWKAANRRLSADLDRACSEKDAVETDAAEKNAANNEAHQRMHALAKRLLDDTEDPVALVRELLIRARHSGPSEPRNVVPITPIHPIQKSARGGCGNIQVSGQVAFHINWGAKAGADARRLLALVCRRSGIRGNQVGAIRIGESFSTFEVDSDVAMEFARRVRKPDPREPRIRIALYEPAFRAKGRRLGPARPEQPREGSPRPFHRGNKPHRKRSMS